MIVSTNLLIKAIEKYQKAKKEKYSVMQSASGGLASGFVAGFLVFAVFFFALELLTLFFAINIAINCTARGPERIVHVVLAITFTLPYMLLNVIFNNCATSYLRGETSEGQTATVPLVPKPSGTFQFMNCRV